MKLGHDFSVHQKRNSGVVQVNLRKYFHVEEANYKFVRVNFGQIFRFVSKFIHKSAVTTIKKAFGFIVGYNKGLLVT